jgi:hypothetical protein
MNVYYTIYYAITPKTFSFDYVCSHFFTGVGADHNTERTKLVWTEVNINYVRMTPYWAQNSL